MKKFFLIIIALVALFSACSVEDDAPSPNNQNITLTADQEILVCENQEYAINLLKQYCLDEEIQGQNIAFSPFFSAAAINLLATAENEDEARLANIELGHAGKSLATVNGFYKKLLKELPQTGYPANFRHAYSMWYEKGMTLTSAYNDLKRNFFPTETFSCSLASAQQKIDDWCSANTNGAISCLDIASYDTLQAVLLNALSFEAIWREDCIRSDRFCGIFHSSDGASEVSFLRKSFLAECLETEHFLFLPCNLEHGAFRMLLILPDEGIGMSEAATLLADGEWKEALDGRFRQRLVSLSLPQFDVSFAATMKRKRLKWDNNEMTFPRIADRQAEIDFLLQKVSFKAGDEATTATPRVPSSSTEPVVIQEITIDRPFLFAISEKTTNLPLILGKVENF